MPVILQVNFATAERPASQAQIESAKAIAQQPGLRWKVWINDEASQTRGGIYLFDDLKSAKAWGDDVLPERLKARGATHISIRYFDVNEDASLVTHAPLLQRAAAA
ncbi:YdhR family protein [Chelatococcus reniformis]|uniref:Monooxygenase n=1 Tax=Chelatococcus reniformis TaxID=1494448 RepID=A0A916UUZ5_9HYPH|nr:YdhR family protein [Chelatococcus reniformis]GGC89728.1 monooxygenase [Chelatococcus reniformis]